MLRFHDWSDARLLTAAREGEAEAFGVLFDRHAELVARFLRRRAASAEDAADLTAETFAAALLSVHNGNAVRVIEAAPWLIGIARNKLIDSYRRGAVEQSAMARAGLERTPLSHSDAARIDGVEDDFGVAQAINQLSPAERRAVIERIVLEHDYDDMAGSQGLGATVLRKRVSRALLRVRDSLGVQA